MELTRFSTTNSSVTIFSGVTTDSAGWYPVKVKFSNATSLSIIWLRKTCEDRLGGAARDRDGVGADRPLAVGREPVAQHVGGDPLGQVRLRGDRVARPRVVYRRRALGDDLEAADG